MDRKQFLKTLGGIGTLAFAAPAGASAGTTPAFRAARTVTEYAGEIGAPPEAVFPLLCPVREYEWLEGWNCEMVYTKTGVAEENCVFKTPLGPSTWNVDRYEPPKRIAFTVVSPDQVNRLTITLEPTATGGTKIVWNRVFTGLTPAGNEKIGAWSTDVDRDLTLKLERFLKTR
jgi:uncharacterized protein YndB with AHSA1/START domain